jgi:spore coat protein U-like protein
MRCWIVKRYLSGVVAASALVGLSASSADALTTATTTLAVSASVQATCVVATPSALAFGTYVPATGATSSTTISVTCTNTTGWNIGLDQGANGSSVTTRQMKNGSATLNYSLTSDAGGSTNWGNTVGTDTVSGTGNGSAQSSTVYGKVPTGQYVTPGSYTDTVNVTVSY